MDATPNLLAIDWGTTALRGALLGADGAVLEQRAVDRGLLTVESGAFDAVFEQTFGDWLDRAPLPCLMAGMVGSRQGWVETPYCACPAGIDEVAGALLRLPAAATSRGRDIRIVPGLSCEHGGVPDVIRGEEVKVFGALGATGLCDAVLVLPGTHTKWVTVAGGRVTRFATVMSGEFYALLRRHSILARSLAADDADAALDPDAFDRGVDQAFASGSLLHSAFSVRTLALFDRLPAAALSSYLSGLVIGEALRGQPWGDVGDVLLMGAPALVDRFERALRRRGAGVRPLGEETAWQGLWALHAHAAAHPPDAGSRR